MRAFRAFALTSVLAAMLSGCASTPSRGDVDSSRSSEELQQRSLHRRAVEAAIWGIPAVNTDLMLQAAKKAGAGDNQIVYWSKPLLDWKNQTLTPNPDAIYFMPFWNTKDVGPVVIEVPPAEEGAFLTGSLMDVWQVPLEDVGPAGADKGKGGKYVIVPPGYTEKVPEGYISLQSQTFAGYGLLRSALNSISDADVTKAVNYAKQIKIYPLSAAANPPPTRSLDAFGNLFDATIPYDVRFFESLDRVVQSEPWLLRDGTMVDVLKTIGIEKGKAFKPNTKTTKALNDALVEAKAWFAHTYETIYPPYYADKQYFVPASAELIRAQGDGFATAGNYPLDARAAIYYAAFSGVKHLGAGQFYLFVTRDRAGNTLDGAKHYKLHVPANVPAEQYWSVVLYDFDTHGLIRDVSRASRSSLMPELAKNADGSTDIYVGPKAPAGNESNWIPTKPGRRFEAIVRFYKPTKALMDKAWVLPDVQEVK